jgi:hypothetical protein
VVVRGSSRNWYLGVRRVVCWVRYVVVSFRDGGWGDGSGGGGGGEHARLRKRRRQYQVHGFRERERQTEQSCGVGAEVGL